jgi:hypothetical protein
MAGDCLRGSGVRGLKNPAQVQKQRGMNLEGQRPVSVKASRSEASVPTGSNMSRVDVAGSNTGTEAGAPPVKFPATSLEGHRPRCPRWSP